MLLSLLNANFCDVLLY